MKKKNWKPIGKRHNWMERTGSSMIFRLKIFDNGMKIDEMFFNTERKFKEILELLRLKYGMNYK